MSPEHTGPEIDIEQGYSRRQEDLVLQGTVDIDGTRKVECCSIG